jgi:hypothetical protein
MCFGVSNLRNPVDFKISIGNLGQQLSNPLIQEGFSKVAEWTNEIRYNNNPNLFRNIKNDYFELNHNHQKHRIY